MNTNQCVERIVRRMLSTGRSEDMNRTEIYCLVSEPEFVKVPLPTGVISIQVRSVIVAQFDENTAMGIDTQGEEPVVRSAHRASPETAIAQDRTDSVAGSGSPRLSFTENRIARRGSMSPDTYV